MSAAKTYRRSSPPVRAVRPLTPELWPALRDLFGARGACQGCWCMYWRIGAGYRRRPDEDNRADFRRVVGRGPPPGLLCFEGDSAVGWCQLTPRAALAWLEESRRLARIDTLPVWALSCFYVRIGHRRSGITAALLAGAIQAAKRAGAPALEAYPLDASRTPSASGTGFLTTFKRAGFKIVANRGTPRPVVRLYF
jgi:GNAT superfamily N-acetyltransferase